jgi:hypothetical protein
MWSSQGMMMLGCQRGCTSLSWSNRVFTTHGNQLSLIQISMLILFLIRGNLWTPDNCPLFFLSNVLTQQTGKMGNSYIYFYTTYRYTYIILQFYVKNTRTKSTMNRTTRNRISMIWPLMPAFFITAPTFFCADKNEKIVSVTKYASGPSVSSDS